MLVPMEQNLSASLKSVLAQVQARITTKSHYFGIKTMKNPMDFWVYREILHDVKPDVVIEIGNFNGGSTLAFAHILDVMNKGRIIAMDIDHSQVPEVVYSHPRITLIEGDACKNSDAVKAQIKPDEIVIVFEDSAHTYDNTLNVLRIFGPMVTPGSFVVIEDSICHHGIDEGPNPGPYEAIETFTAENSEFNSERDFENFGITWNPKGYIRRTGGAVTRTEVRAGVSLAQHSNLRNNIRKVYISLTPPVLVSLIRRLRGTT